jgi:hypothetical protein
MALYDELMMQCLLPPQSAGSALLSSSPEGPAAHACEAPLEIAGHAWLDGLAQAWKQRSQAFLQETAMFTCSGRQSVGQQARCFRHMIMQPRGISLMHAALLDVSMASRASDLQAQQVATLAHVSYRLPALPAACVPCC